MLNVISLTLKILLESGVSKSQRCRENWRTYQQINKLNNVTVANVSQTFNVENI